MRWTIFAKIRRKPVSLDDELPTAWNTSFARAIKGLSHDSGAKIVIERRRLANLRECIDHYPGKTLVAQVRDLRTNLLPLLQELPKNPIRQSPIEEAWWPATYNPLYNPASLERYHLGRLAKIDVDRLRSTWLELRAELKMAFAATMNDLIFSLLVTGAALFEEIGYTDRRSFREISERCCASGALQPDLVARVNRFADAFMRPSVGRALGLKSLLHAFVGMPRHGRYFLKDHTKKGLHKLRKDYIESLPGFHVERGTCVARYSALLEKLIDQSVFQEFRFVTLTA